MLIASAQISLIFCMLFAAVYAVGLLIAAERQHGDSFKFIIPGAIFQWLLIAFPYIVLTYSFIIHDFSLSYVANNSSLQQPLLYRIAAVWGAHEGSLLFWTLVQATWLLLVSYYSQSLPKHFVARVVAVLSILNVGVLSFMLFTSNPFETIPLGSVMPRELNPLLQDPGLAFHPPLLYIGYVGFSVAFAFAFSALLARQFDASWARWVKPWTLTAWAFLTLGITLGSLWAYYELGWGGWWFWDPVENASLMPWLLGTALIHSLTVTARRNSFIGWSLLLALSAFSLSLLGTFLVRSGILTSVHAFASDPERGLFILIFLVLVIGSALILYALRAGELTRSIPFVMASKETGLMVNAIFLTVFAFTVLFGTLFPLIFEAFNLGKISVGTPYFNKMFLLFSIPLALIVGLGSMLHWQRDQLGRFFNPVALIALLSLVIAALVNISINDNFSLLGFIGLALASWVVLWTLLGIAKRFSQTSSSSRLQPATFWGMNTAHLGIAVLILGITHVSQFSHEKHLVMTKGEQFELADYIFHFDGIRAAQGDNFIAQEGLFRIEAPNGNNFILTPQKRFYASSTKPMTEAAIDSNLFRDVYISLGDDVTHGMVSEWSIRIYYKSAVACIWLGGLLMAIGALISVLDKRYRMAPV